MKKILILALAIVMSASIAFAQSGGNIGAYSDVAGTNCDLVTVQGLTFVYVVHTAVPSAASSQFKADVSASGMTYLGQNAGANLFTGSTVAGTITEGGAFAYVQCRALPYLIVTLQFFASGFEPACGVVDIVADPAEPSGEILMVDCNFDLHFATGSKLVVNGNETCPCVEVVSTEESSWSKIKAMYQ